MQVVRRCCFAMFRSCSCKGIPLEPEQEDPNRFYWPRRFDFLFASVSFTVGVSNMLYFPVCCSSYGGAAFLIPYLIAIVFAVLPLVFLEMAYGQFTGLGPVHGWRECPIMTGVGWSIIFIHSTIAIFYCFIIALCVHLMIGSFNTKLPWSDCDREWNDHQCFVMDRVAQGVNRSQAPQGSWPCMETQRVNCTKEMESETPALQYFERKVLGYISYTGELRRMTDSLGPVQWDLALCLLGCWVATFLCVFNGVRTYSRLIYIAAPMPLFLLLVLLVRVITLPGALSGLKFFFTPNFSELARSDAWTTGIKQAFFSMDAVTGAYMTLASHNRFRNNCHADAIAVCILDTIASVMCALTTFAGLGYISQQTGVPMPDIAKSNSDSLPFVVYMEVMSRMPAAPLWSSLLFAMLITLGLATQIVTVQTISAPILEQWPCLRFCCLGEVGFMASLCCVFFLLGLPMCCKGGIYAFHVVSTYPSSYNHYVVAIGEILGVCVFYGLENFLGDVEAMLGFRPGIYWTACWTVVCPVLFLFILVFSIVIYNRPEVVRGQEMSDWGETIGYGIMVFSLLIIVGFAIAWRPVLIARQAAERQTTMAPEELRPSRYFGPSQRSLMMTREELRLSRRGVSVLSRQSIERNRETRLQQMEFRLSDREYFGWL